MSQLASKERVPNSEAVSAFVAPPLVPQAFAPGVQQVFAPFVWVAGWGKKLSFAWVVGEPAPGIKKRHHLGSKHEYARHKYAAKDPAMDKDNDA